MTIYALTLTWNAKDYLEKLHQSMLKVRSSSVTDIIWFIRDNNSNDGTEELVKSWNDDVYIRYFKADHNLDSFAKCNNFLVEKVKEQENINYDKDYFLLLNNDITIEDPTAINTMLQLDRDDVGVIGAKLCFPNSKMIQHGGVAFSQKHGSMPWHIFTGDQDSKFTNQNREFQAVTGAFMLVKANCYKNLQFGKMDEKYNWAFDDICLCLDVKYLQKKKVLYCGKTKIFHHESFTLSKNKCHIMYMNSNVNLFKKQWGRVYKLDYYNYMEDPNYNLYKG